MSMWSWVLIVGAGLALWIVSGWVVKVVGFVARLLVRLIIVVALLGLGWYVFGKMTKTDVPQVQWKA